MVVLILISEATRASIPTNLFCARCDLWLESDWSNIFVRFPRWTMEQVKGKTSLVDRFIGQNFICDAPDNYWKNINAVMLGRLDCERHFLL